MARGGEPDRVPWTQRLWKHIGFTRADGVNYLALWRNAK